MKLGDLMETIGQNEIRH